MRSSRPGPYFKISGRRLCLPGPMALFQPLVERLGPGRGPPELGVPVPGDRQQVRVEGVAQFVDRL